MDTHLISNLLDPDLPPVVLLRTLQWLLLAVRRQTCLFCALMKVLTMMVLQIGICIAVFFPLPSLTPPLATESP